MPSRHSLSRRLTAGMFFLILVACGKPAAHPVRPLKLDGCSAAPDFNFRSCCDAHDREYYCGGTREQRKASDQKLRECIREKGHPQLAKWYFLGVRVGGGAYMPAPWRWGFGLPYGQGYVPPIACDVAEAE